LGNTIELPVEVTARLRQAQAQDIAAERIAIVRVALKPVPHLHARPDAARDVHGARLWRGLPALGGEREEKRSDAAKSGKKTG
jgi:hypothetical protein